MGFQSSFKFACKQDADCHYKNCKSNDRSGSPFRLLFWSVCRIRIRPERAGHRTGRTAAMSECLNACGDLIVEGDHLNLTAIGGNPRRFGLLAATLAKNAFCAIIWSAVSALRFLGVGVLIIRDAPVREY